MEKNNILVLVMRELERRNVPSKYLFYKNLQVKGEKNYFGFFLILVGTMGFFFLFLRSSISLMTANGPLCAKLGIFELKFWYPP